MSAARVMPIGGGNEREDFTGRVVDANECGVAEVGVFEFCGFFADDFFEVVSYACA